MYLGVLKLTASLLTINHNTLDNEQQIKVMVAGGSSMPLVLEDFFDMIRTPVIVGYGMTVRS